MAATSKDTTQYNNMPEKESSVAAQNFQEEGNISHEQENMPSSVENMDASHLNNTSNNKEAMFKSKHDKHDNDKAGKVKGKKKRELDSMMENSILNSRFRSSSGKVYSSSVSVDARSASNSSISDLQMVIEGEHDCGESLDDLSSLEMCPKEGCCKGMTTLIDMIGKLQKSVDGALKKFDTQEILISNSSHRVQDLQDQMEKQDEAIDDIDRELQDTKFKLQLVSNIVIRQDQQISFLKEKINEIHQREMTSNVIVSGITERKNENPIQAFNQFVQGELELQELIPANKAFRLGSGTNRPLLVELRHSDNKKKLFGNIGKLKGKKNEKGNSYFLSDHLPEEMNETRRRSNELFAENKKKQSSHQLEMGFVHGKLMINEEPYNKSIHAPSAKEILNPNEDLFNKAKELDIVKGKKEAELKSKFVSYAVAVQDFDDIQAAYLNIRMKFPDATHVACAFRLPGSNTPQNQDYVDDGEFGCGRTMLKVLKEAQFMNMAVFIVRFYGGKHLGVRRFEIFRDLAKVAIKNLMDKREREQSQGPSVEHLPDNLEQPPISSIATAAQIDWSTPVGWDEDQQVSKKTD